MEGGEWGGRVVGGVGWVGGLCMWVCIVNVCYRHTFIDV